MFSSKLTNIDSGTMVGLATAAGVYLIFNQATPTATDVRAADAHDGDVEKSRKQAAWISAALVAGVFLVARDLNSYIISGVALVGIDYMYKHSNAVDPQTGRLASGQPSNVYSLPQYATDDADVSEG